MPKFSHAAFANLKKMILAKNGVFWGKKVRDSFLCEKVGEL